MNTEKRRTGIDALGDVCWGKHICVFYRSISDLVDLVVPFFMAGLENNELCLWSLSEGLGVGDAETILTKRIKDLSGYIAKGQLRIVDSIYEGAGGFEPEKAKLFWTETEKQALEMGFDGIRVTGSGNWAEKLGWERLFDYEKDVDGIIKAHKMIALCTYSAGVIGLSNALTITERHGAVIVKRQDREDAFDPDDTRSILARLNAMSGKIE